MLNCIAKPDMGCMALFVNVSSIKICPFFLANVPLISSPLPLAAGNQTYNGKSEKLVLTVEGYLLKLGFTGKLSTRVVYFHFSN